MKDDSFVGMENGFPNSCLTYEDLCDRYTSESTELMPVEDMLKLAYNRLTNCTIDTAKYEICMKKALAEARPTIENISNFGIFFDRLIYNQSYADRTKPLTTDEIKSITIEEMNELLKEYNSDFNGATFILACEDGMRTLRPLIEKYLGSLPSKHRKKEMADIDAFHFKSQNDSAKYTYKSDFSRADIIYGLTQDANDGYEYSQEKHILLEALWSVMKQSLHENVRLAEGNVYTIEVGMRNFYVPTQRQLLFISTPCDPNNTEGMMAQIDNVVEQMANGDLLKESYVENYIANRLKTLEDKNTSSPNYIRNLACDYAFTDEIVSNTDNKELIKSVTAEKLRAFLSEILQKGSKKKMVMTTE